MMPLSAFMGARDHHELDCWILADQVRQRTLAIVRSGRLSAHPWLNTQLAKSSSSGCANIAEGFSRFNPKEFARHLTFAKASLSETIDHLASAFRLGLLRADEVDEIGQLAARARGAATKLIVYLKNAEPPGSPQRRRPGPRPDN